MPDDQLFPSKIVSPPSDQEPLMLGVAERLLQTSDGAWASEIADVAILFYVAVGTIAGALLAACAYPLVFDFDVAHRGSWIFFLICAVGAGSVIGFACVSLLLNMKGLITWERKHLS